MKKLLIDTPEEIAARFEERLPQKKKDAPAFPQSLASDGPFGGMTLHDWFSGQALAGLLASGPHDCDQNELVHDARLFADAMLAAREEGGGE